MKGIITPKKAVSCDPPQQTAVPISSCVTSLSLLSWAVGSENKLQVTAWCGEGADQEVTESFLPLLQP